MHHRSAEGFFIESAKKIVAQDVKDVKATAMAAYVAGFICHFACDNACHPLVFQLEHTGVAHSLIESEFDKYILSFCYRPSIVLGYRMYHDGT